MLTLCSSDEHTNLISIISIIFPSRDITFSQLIQEKPYFVQDECNV